MMEFAVIIFLWITFSIAAGIIASARGRSPFGYFLLALLLSPIVGITAAVVAMPNKEVLEARAFNPRKQKRCASCHEVVRIEASICRYCHKTEFIKSL